MRILVTGGAGVIGSHCTRMLSSGGRTLNRRARLTP